MYLDDGHLTLSLADAADRRAIYAMRHDVYARELAQHAENADRVLTDRLDEVNSYIVIKRGGKLTGFVAITPPNPHGYSIDKYFAREAVPLTFDDRLYEVRLLTVARDFRSNALAGMLMYAALRFVESQGAAVVVAIGRLEVLDLYSRVGLEPLGLQVTSGAVTFELMAAQISDLRSRIAPFRRVVNRFERSIDWQLPGVPYRADGACYHGGSFFTGIGDEFNTLEQKDHVISADVLDAWFDPAPSVTAKLGEHLAFAVKTSPPTQCEGTRRAIARARGVPEDSVLPGAGSSDLIFAGLRHWVGSRSRVLILDPMYGEYAHLLERTIGASLHRFGLSRRDDYDVDCGALSKRLSERFDWVVLVNPNSPTGRHVPRKELEQVLAGAPSGTRFWIDETYIEYAGAGESLESFAAASHNIVVCKSMSKMYALSGVRAAYLCGAPNLIGELRAICPPWSVSLPGQIAACEALKAADYYRARWNETHLLRRELADALKQLGWDVVPGCANFLLCHLPASGPDGSDLVRWARHAGLFLREVGDMGTNLDGRAVRIAVKDRRTNGQMIEILSRAMESLSLARRAAV